MSTLKIELGKLATAHPAWTFAKCWDTLKRTQPDLFSNSATDYSADQPSAPSAASRERISAALRLRQRVECVAASEGLSFAQAWAALRKREPELFEVVTAAHKSEVVVCQGGFATPLW